MAEIPIVDDWIENAFLDGVLEVYNEIFTKKLPFYYLDEEASKPNSYGEIAEKQFLEPIYLTARVRITEKEGEKAVNRTHRTAQIRIPTRNLWDNGIPTDQESLDRLLKGKFEFNGVTYYVRRIQPKTLINDHFIMIDFYCDEDFYNNPEQLNPADYEGVY